MTINRKVAPNINEISSFNIVEAKKAELSNGIELYMIDSGQGELIKIEMMFAAGNWFQSSPLAAFTVNNTLVEGTANRSSKQIAEVIDFYGAKLSYNVDKDNAYVSLFTLRKHLANVIDILADIIKNAQFPENEIKIFAQKHKQQFLIEQEKVSTLARNIHSKIMFGKSHPYGFQIDVENFEELNTSALQSFYSQFYTFKNCRIIVSGRVQDTDIQLIEDHLGKEKWGNGSATNNNIKLISPEPDNTIFVEKKGAVQNAIRIGKIIGNKQNPDYPGLSVLNCILGGYFGSRLMKKIREEKGYTYGINSLLVTLVNSGYLTIVTEVGSDVTKPALEDIFGEIEILRTELVPMEELTRVKNYMLGEMVRMFDGPFAQAESLISLLEYNLGYDYYDHLIHEISTVTPDRIIELAKKYLEPGSFSQVVVGNPF